MKKNLSLGLLSVLLITLLAFTVSAANTIAVNSPVNYGNYSATMNVSITNNYINSTTGSYNVSLYCNKSGGSVDARTGSDVTKLVTISNSSAKVSNFENAAVSISSLTDAITYNCSAYADNGSATGGQAWSAAVKGITIDNTDPTITIAIANVYVDYMSSQSVTCSCSDNIDSAPTTTRTLTKGNTGKTVTVTSSPYTLVGSDLNVLGKNTWTCACVDYTGNTNSESKTFTIQTDEEIPKGQDTATTTQKNNTLMIIVYIVLAAIALVIVVVIIALKDNNSKSGRKSGKRRRR